MDRREALKKLGMGGAMAVGTTAMLSSTAFAHTVPTAPASAGSSAIIVSLTMTGAGSQATLNWSVASSNSWPAGTCPGSANGTPSIGDSGMYWVVKNSTGIVQNSGSSTSPGNVTISRGSGNWDVTDPRDTCTVIVSRKYTCTYGAGSASICVGATQVFTAATDRLAGSSWSGAAATWGVVANCV